SPIEVGFLSKYPITNVSEISPGKDYGLRNILEITIDVDGNSLKLINNHWKSKLGSFSENLRIKSSLVLQNRLNELKNDEVIILGDFNENYNESTKVSYTTAITLKNKGDGLRISGSKDLGENEYYTPWPYSGFEGSYLYKDNWETIDNFFLNRNLFDDSKFSYSSFRVDNRDLLFDSGSNICKWRNDLEFGYSDHLPIILEIVINKIETTLE
ncbi:MAG: hypothetical protein JXR64_04625, partial [Spirochaetales bacterium]|nr:hypothetical protein [Spirochaetales bacterium]